jgi:hypothetical protein
MTVARRWNGSEWEVIAQTVAGTSGGGSSAPANMVTTDTAQDITAQKTLSHIDGTIIRAIRAVSGQVVALRDHTGNLRAMVGSTGVTVGTSNPPSGAGVLALNNANTVPTSSPPSGVVFYAEAGVLKVRQQDGTVHTVGGAAGPAPANMLTTDTQQVVTGGKTFQPGTLYMRMPDGLNVAEPYSDANPPETLQLTAFTGTIPNPPAGQATVSTPDGLNLLIQNDAGATRTVAVNDAAAVGGTTILRLSAAGAVTGTTQTQVMATSSLPAGTYLFEVEGFYSGSTTAQGLRASVPTATATNYAASLETFYSTALPSGIHAGFTSTNGGTLGAATASLTTPLPFRLKGSVTTSAAGVIALRIASSTTGTINLAVGTYMRVTRVA